jgi:threonine dehydrogenase-like Zn-dependent dehydrogenase
MPEGCVYRVDLPVSDLAALLIEPFAAALRGVRKLGTCVGLRGLIFGAGPMGLLTVVAARLAGAVVEVVDPKTDRLRLAAELGAQATHPGVTEEGRGKFDFVIETAGVPVAVEQAIQTVRPGGTVVFLGLCTGASRVAEIDIARRELVVVGSVLYSRWEFAAAVSLAAQGVLDSAASMVTHVLPLDEATEAFRTAELQQGVKVAVRGWEA